MGGCRYLSPRFGHLECSKGYDMKWGEFKAAVEAQDVSDETDIAWIDYDGSPHLKVDMEASRITIVETWFPSLDEDLDDALRLPTEGSDVI